MGNFYTNFSVINSQPEAIREFLKKSSRKAYLGPDHHGIFFVYDSDCDEQDLEEIELLGQGLSKELNCTVLSALNHDDDYLILRLFARGRCVGEYNHFWHGVVFGFKLSYYFRRWISCPFIVLSLTFPYMLFQFIRHRCLARNLGLPPWVVGVGYRYIRQNDLPYDMDISQFESI